MNFGNLGIALGAYTRQADSYAKEDEDKRRWEANYGLQKAAEGRAAEQFNWQTDDHNEAVRVRDAEKALSEKYKPLFAAAANGDYSFAPAFLKGGYNTNSGAWNDGNTAVMQNTKDGAVLHIVGPDSTIKESHQLNPQKANELLTNAYMMERAGIGAAQFKDYTGYGLDSRKVGAAENTANAGMQNARTMEGYRANQYELGKEANRIRAMEVGNAAAYHNALANQAKFGSAQQMLDNEGNLVYMIPSMGKDGTVTPTYMKPGDGYRPVRDPNPRATPTLKELTEAFPRDPKEPADAYLIRLNQTAASWGNHGAPAQPDGGTALLAEKQRTISGRQPAPVIPASQYTGPVTDDGSFASAMQSRVSPASQPSPASNGYLRGKAIDLSSPRTSAEFAEPPIAQTVRDVRGAQAMQLYPRGGMR